MATQNTDSSGLASQIASRIEGISTHWSVVAQPAHFTLRYAPAIRRYLGALVDGVHDQEEVLQDFLCRVMQDGFQCYERDRGRFRDYLKGALRNAARRHFRERDKHETAADVDLDQLPAIATHELDWNAEWTQCLLDRAWEALHKFQLTAAEGNLCHTVLRLTADHPDDSSDQLAARASELVGRPLRADAFRKQISRARRKFAELLLAEVAETLHRPSADDVLDELAALGLLDYVRPYVGDEWVKP